MKPRTKRRIYLREAAFMLVLARLAVRLLPAARIFAWASRPPRRIRRFAVDETRWVAWAVEHVGSHPRVNALCLPRAHDKVLSFHAWKPGDRLVSGFKGIQEPEAKAKERRPDFIIVPLLAFDKNGYRLGYGGGYYDRYLAAHRAKRTFRAVGIAYAGQQVDELPHEDFDERLDAVVTEAQVIRFERD